MVMTEITASAVSTAKAFCPGHITGFLAKVSDFGEYEMLKKNDASISHLHKGSLGAGLAIDMGITTTVKVFDKGNNYSRTSYDVLINGLNKNSNIEVTKSVVEQYVELLHGRSYHIKIEHETAIPIGYGLSSSGAAALSLSYALNRALNVGLDMEQAAQIAHRSEIECKTGLGSVLAQYVGGFELRSKIGGPGVGVVSSLPYHSSVQDFKVIILCLSPLSTKKFLTDHVGLLNGYGEEMLERFSISRSINDFLDISFEFATRLGLIRGKSGSLIKELKSQGFGSSVALFGETIFSIVKSNNVDNVINCLKGNGGTLLICGIDHHGARIIDKQW
jgi:pantoate kinase